MHRTPAQWMQLAEAAYAEIERLQGNMRNRERYILEQRARIERLVKVILKRGKEIKRLRERVVDLLGLSGEDQAPK